jgi:hypothetical protein
MSNRHHPSWSTGALDLDDPQFWRSFFHHQSGSIGAAVTGWLSVLFPYLVDWTAKQPTAPNEYMATRTNASHDMRFVAGMFGVIEDSAGGLSPEFNGAITYDR